MPETANKLAFVAISGQQLPSSHAVLIHALRGWHVALLGVPTHACPCCDAV